MVLKIRPATSHDEPAVSHICLMTADAGKSADALFKNKELPGLVYAVPYLHLSSAFRFVLVNSQEEGTSDNVVGYVIGSTDCRAFEKDEAENWWPNMRAKYPHPPDSEKSHYNEREWKCFDAISCPPTIGQEVLDVYQAFLHINILEPYRRKGWGSKLIQVAAETVKKDNGKGLWVGIDPRNDEARKFYLAIGFEKIESGNREYYGLDIDRFLESRNGGNA